MKTTEVKQKPVVQKSLASEGTVKKTPTVLRKKSNEIGTPSISMALSGNLKEESQESSEDKKINDYIKSVKEENKSFTKEQLHNCWSSLVEKYTEQIHLHNTLQHLPDLKNGNIVVVNVENSVQQEALRLAKPEIIGFLRRTLNNSTIDVSINLQKSSAGRKVLTDEQKLKAMIKKNPALQLFKNQFNLDFNG